MPFFIGLDLARDPVDETSAFAVRIGQALKIQLESFEGQIAGLLDRTGPQTCHQPHRRDAEDAGEVDEARSAGLRTISFPGEQVFAFYADSVRHIGK